MPHPEIERLTSGSDKAQKQAAISACIQREVNAGKDQEQAQAMCYDMADRQMGGGE